MTATLTAVYERLGDWYIGYVEELPGANVQERTLEEARASMREVVQFIIECNQQLANNEL
jgi:predicted RNase H-like HicB family nuclease